MAPTTPTDPAASPEIISCVDLPRDDPRSRSLSGLAWDRAQRRLFAICDEDPRLTVLEPSIDFTDVALGPSIALDVPLDLDAWDGEAVVLAGDRFVVVANETQPLVVELDRAGHGATPVALPDYRGIRNNLGIESIAYAASAAGRFMFFANEQALTDDGPTSTAARGTVVRLLRRPLDGGRDLQIAYLTDPIFVDGPNADNGVSDIAALSPDRVLVLERAYVSGHGNAIRIYEVDLRGAADIAALPDARAAAPIAKRLVLDLGTTPDERCSPPQMPQRRRSFDNYEGLAVGPTLPDGRRLLFLVSDDNNRAAQIPRLLTVALPAGALP